ncbi:hypothetical protein DFQ28_004885 [Apophysomyces sp. BC1034]|nr:hypothetical protein DFQ30_010114 [Apophysomyces sp. BC1015]KAG0178178.1 hypothetical protein DFQ29_003830 [Apophysomyces sp. BC1021]KAG0188424.1 hypothetical protein DFQ28_004885 [Apophysomyces sp. BC1034]
MTTSDVRPVSDPFGQPSSATHGALLGCSELYRLKYARYNSPPKCTYDPPPPPRQFTDASCQERTVMIENLVDTSVEILNSIWYPHHQNKVISTRGFIREILRRSKTTYTMLQIALFYVFRVKQVVHQKLRQRSSSNSGSTAPTTAKERQEDGLMCCGRRMFLASLMLASKYLHDKAYRNMAWAQIAGLDVAEINAAERIFLQMIDYRLHVTKASFEKWCLLLNGYIQRQKTNPNRQSYPDHASNTRAIDTMRADPPSDRATLREPLTPESSPLPTPKRVRVMEQDMYPDHTAKRIRRSL